MTIGFAGVILCTSWPVPSRYWTGQVKTL